LFSLFSCFPALVFSTPQDSVSLALENARWQSTKTLTYDPGYTRIPYPGGDVPIERGVCSDVIIRAFRGAGVDLQVLVHQDMAKSFSAYPHIWGLARPDTNIDHRRVPNLMKFFQRMGKSLPVTLVASDYLPGDVVAWRLPGGLLHVGIVMTELARDNKTPLVAHNIGQGAKIEDVLFRFEILGHYRYF